jgi:ankyrin repeat protein
MMENTISVLHRITSAIEENDIYSFVRLLGETNDEKLQRAQKLLGNCNDAHSQWCDPLGIQHTTPFLLCAQYGRYKMLEYMLNIPNININQLGYYKHDALSLILMSGEIDNLSNATKCAKLLLSRKSFDITVVDSFNRNLLHLAAKLDEGFEILKMLLKRKQIDVNIGDNEQINALLYSVRKRNAVNTRILVREPNIHINHLDGHGQSVLRNFLYSGLEENGLLCCRQLLSHPDINVDYISKWSNTAVTYIVKDNLTHALLIHGRI